MVYRKVSGDSCVFTLVFRHTYLRGNYSAETNNQISDDSDHSLHSQETQNVEISESHFPINVAESFKIQLDVTVIITIWAATLQNQQSDCAPSEDSDQPRHPPSLISVFAVRMKKAWVLSYPLSGREDSDQTGRMPGLIRVFAEHTLILSVLSCRGSYSGVIRGADNLIRLLGTFYKNYRSNDVFTIEPRHEKTCLRGFRPDKTLTGLLS